MKNKVMTPFRAPRKTTDKTQDTNRKVRVRKQKQARQQPVPESEEATANGLVWPEPEEQVLTEESSNPWWPDLPSTEIVNAEVQCPGKSMGDEESPRLTDYESEGYIARREARKKVSEGHQRRKFSEGFMLLTAARDKQIKDLAVARAKADLLAKDKIVRKAQTELAKDKRAVNKSQLNRNQSSDDDDDNVPFSTLISKAVNQISASDNVNEHIAPGTQKDSPIASKIIPISLSSAATNQLPLLPEPKAKQTKKAKDPSWSYEPAVSTASPYWDVMAVHQVAAIVEEAAITSETNNDGNEAGPREELADHEKLNVLASVTARAASIVYPKGVAAIGVEVARDFGGAVGICCGKIVTVDVVTRRPLYHVVYSDGDEEDYDDAELQFAIDLLFAFKAGVALAVESHEDDGMFNRPV
jgi:hypothetical protein